VLAAPGAPWKVPGAARDGVVFALASSLDLGAAGALLGRALAPEADGDEVLERRSRVWAAGGYRRTDDATGAVRGLEHPDLGAVYVDLRDRTFLHLGPEQLVVPAHPDALRRAKADWSLDADGRTTVLRLRGPVALDLAVRHATTSAPPEALRAMLDAALPGVADLEEIGLPFAKLARAGAPERLELWRVDAAGRRTARLARHRFSGVRVGPVEPDELAIPRGFRDLRDRGDGRAWHPAARRPLRRRAADARARAGARAPRTAPARGAAAAGTIGTFVPAPPVVATQPALPSCHPSTLDVTAALEVRQALLDVVAAIANAVTTRLGAFSGARVSPGDPDDTEVALTVDWLDQFQAFSEGLAQGDAVFCLLRDPPPEDDPLGGGDGLLDRLAASLAAALLAEEDPLPLGGEDDPVLVEQAVENAIAAVVADPGVAPEERFAALGATSRAALREAVLAQRIATLDLRFEGSFGEHPWPSASLDLVHVRLQLEELALDLDHAAVVDALRIDVDDDGRPRVDLGLLLPALDATIRMDRSPGLWFWIVAPGALVAAGVAVAAVGALVTALMGLGPLGLLVLLAVLSAAPLAALAAVAGGALLLGAVAYLVWDASLLRVRLADAALRTRLSPSPADDPEELVLDPGPVTLEGEIEVTVASQVPSGVHQLFDWVANAAIEAFEAQVRDVLEDVLGAGVAGAVRRLPHVRLPQPARVRVGVPVTGPSGVEALADLALPEHELRAHAANGAPEVLLAASATTTTRWPYAALRPYLTQVEADGREALAARTGARQGRGGALLGYALSQNLLNVLVFSRWLSGRLALDYDADRTAAAFAALVAACPECAAVTEARAAHVWAAGPPRVLVSPRAFAEDPRRPSLLAQLPDVRVCLSGVAGKRSSLEVQFAVTAIAHVAFGAPAASGAGRTLFTVERAFLDVRFDDRAGFFRLDPVETQGLVASGPGFAAIAAMDPARRLALLRDLQPVLALAASRLLRRHGAGSLAFDGEDLGRQRYDGLVAVEVAPRGTSLDVTFALEGPILLLLPAREADGAVVPPTIDLADRPCADGAALRELAS